MDESEIAFIQWWNTKQPLEDMVRQLHRSLSRTEMNVIRAWIRAAYFDAWKLRESETIIPRRGD